MSTLLRKVKSTIHAPSNASVHNADSFSKTHDHPQNRQSCLVDLNTAVESPYSVHLRQQNQLQPHLRPLSVFRRRLVRKASTFSLRTKGRVPPKYEFLEGHRREEEYSKRTIATTGTHSGQEQSESNLSQISTSTCILANRYCPGTTQEASIEYENCGSRAVPPLPDRLNILQQTIRAKQVRLERAGYIGRQTDQDTCIVRMAPASATPPVPYTRLQEITTSACEKALSSVSAYAHASTEEWNTTIINTILGTLVKETSSSSGGADASASQPPFKYVVNSTIIQHAPAISSQGENTSAATGRRGMHAASGAYWNNEKDGMWSYKYSAAEKQGLDVVIGIIWVWVG